ncbi:hypothetical protein K5P26_14055 [Sphingopyxis sp. XHP0097]|uniref:Uncharacterized protein n=1 Tax=Sphingopyxis jiangsuensis TaxID=2871171 RepID=A0ABS7MGX9_9SPHN|nr:MULTISPECIES: hypothetical protein [Sphingopyxis]MBY4638265.1 hypothetical protein [Sphingopyxis jiangsuensis]
MASPFLSINFKDCAANIVIPIWPAAVETAFAQWLVASIWSWGRSRNPYLPMKCRRTCAHECGNRHVGRFARLAYLALANASVILDDTQPATLASSRLLKLTAGPSVGPTSAGSWDLSGAIHDSVAAKIACRDARG